MSSKELAIESKSAEDTELIGALVGKRLRGGEVVELVSDLGGGKTTFVRGMARGIGSRDTVASPSFTISKLYRSSKFDLHHFDFYRLNDAGLMAHELRDVAGDPHAVAVIEWAGIARHVLPANRLTVNIEYTNETARRLVFYSPRELDYLLEDLC